MNTDKLIRVCGVAGGLLGGASVAGLAWLAGVELRRGVLLAAVVTMCVVAFMIGGLLGMLFASWLAVASRPPRP